MKAGCGLFYGLLTPFSRRTTCVGLTRQISAFVNSKKVMERSFCGGGLPGLPLDLGLHPASVLTTPTAFLKPRLVGSEYGSTLSSTNKPAEHKAQDQTDEEQGEGEHVHREQSKGK